MFKVGESYSKSDIYGILNVPAERQKGAWDTGYRKYLNDIFIFVNLGVPGRTGFDHNNYWDGDDLVWHAKQTSNIRQPIIQEMLSTTGNVLIFTRTDSRLPFTFEGNAFVKKSVDSKPVEIVWGFKNFEYNSPEISPNEINSNSPLVEGAYKEVRVNKYERNRQARRECIDHYGSFCQVCGFNFSERYGSIAKEFIHVHHVVPIAEIKTEYIIDPVKDLIPVCPNCHAIIHLRNPPFSIEEVKSFLK